MVEHRFDLVTREHRHRVAVSSSLLRAHARWYLNDELWGAKKSWQQEFTVRGADNTVGDIEVATAVPARPYRVAWQPPEQGRDGLLEGGIELTPEPGSYAALRQQRAREHPTLFVLTATLTPLLRWGLSLLLPLLLGLIALVFVVAIPWPTIPWPTVPWPDIKWPDVNWPNINLPALPELPDWLATALKVGLGVLVAWGLARRELNRRHAQDEQRSRDDAALRQELMTGLALGLRELETRRADTQDSPASGSR